MTYRLSGRAEADLLDVFIESGERFGAAQANRYRGELVGRFEAIAQHPRRVRERAETDPPVRIVRHKAHLIIYREQDGDVLIIRIAHARSDWLSDLG